MNNVAFINFQDGTIRFPEGPPIGHVRNVRETDDGGLEYEIVFTPDPLTHADTAACHHTPEPD